MNDIIADTLSRLKNGVERSASSVVVMKAKIVKGMLEILQREAMINGYRETDDGYEVDLKYFGEDEKPEILHFERVSKPGQRIYVSTKEIFPVLNGRGISIISTSQGLLTGAQAKSMGIGGEYLCKVY